MVPVIAASGASFQGAFHYYCHDKQGRTTARVSWTQTVNMLTDCVAKAWKVMAYTAKSQDRLKEVAGQKATGRKLRKPVFAYSLSWAPEERPDQATMLAAAMRSLEELGLAEHQAIVVSHSDRPHSHVHVIVNTVHPRTGLVAKLTYSKRKLSDFASRYEREGGHIYCELREQNRRQREEGQTTTYALPAIADAWAKSADAAGFAAALEARGYQLAHGRKRLVVVDPVGKTINPVRHLGGATARDFNVRMSALDPASLPTPEQTLARRQAARGACIEEELPKEQQAKAALEKVAARREEERRELDRRCREELLEKRQELGRFYGVAAKRAALSRLIAERDREGIWRRLAGMLFGRDRRLRHEIELKTAELSDIRARAHEALRALESSHALARAGLELRQKIEREDCATVFDLPNLSSQWRDVANGHEVTRSIWPMVPPRVFRMP
ncbi:relaxase/mobilization nuclease domain-containing protein [Luteolibacter sp. Populi]|uniref:relaxase/mobilization nuclease domain-containing protein n=1 Tax=Luteolibacter sp. Populi TaxID=3230487 RepID=UPI0034659D36